MSAIDKNVIEWLLGGDPAISWQVQRDLMGLGQNKAAQTRQLVEKEGWGKKLLGLQDEDGKWAGQLYNKKWVSTTYTMLLLKDMGMPQNDEVLKGCRQLFENGIYEDSQFRFSKNQNIRDDGVTGLVLSILCYFGYPDERLSSAARHLVSSQNSDGSWYYDKTEAAQKYAFEMTLITLKALLEYRRWNKSINTETADAIKAGQEFLLAHRLYKSLDGNESLNKKWLMMPFPCYWFYDVLSALDYFRECDIKDERLADAVKILCKKQNAEGTWNLNTPHAGAMHFNMEDAGKPSRWNTLKCLRVLKWWEG